MVAKPGRNNNAATTSTSLPKLTEADIQPDLSLLPQPISDTSAAACLAVRAARDEHYTRIGARIVVGLDDAASQANASKSEEANSKLYAARFRGLAESEAELPIHLYDVVGSAFLNLLRTQKDQSIIISGHSTPTSHHMITRHLCDLSKSSQKKSKTQSAILRAEQVLAVFGNARGLNGVEEQMYSRVTEFQFDETGRIVGAKFLTYLLNSTRLTDAPKGCRSFNIISVFLSSLTPDERAALLLPADIVSSCSYLHSVPKTVLLSGASMTLPELFDYFSYLKITKPQQGAVMKLLAGILHLGRLHFTDDPQSGFARLKSHDMLDEVAEILEVSPEKLLTTLTNKTARVGHDVYSVDLNGEGAMAQTAAVARAMYSTLFDFVVDKCNTHLCRNESEWTSFISVVDFPSRLGGGMSLHALMGNVGAERMWEFADGKIGSGLVRILRQEGCEASEFKPSNVATLSLLGSPERGLVYLINNQINQPPSTDGSMISSIINTANVTPSKSNQKSFIISHSHGMVEYDLHDWRSGVETTSNELVGLFSSDGTLGATFFQPVIAAAQLQAAETLARSKTVARSKSVNGRDGREASSPLTRKGTVSNRNVKFETALTRLYSDLDLLVEALQETSIWVALCFSTTPSSTRSKFDLEFISTQAIAYGLGALASSPAAVYFTDYSFEEFVGRYAAAHPALGDATLGNPQQRMAKFVATREWSQDDVIVGKTRLYISDIAWQELEADLSEATHNNFKENFEKAQQQPIVAMSEFGDDVDYDSKLRPGETEPLPVQIDLLPSANEKKPKLVRVEREEHLSPSRRAWLCLTWSLTWYIPSIFLSFCGRMKRRDIQIAWREKVAIFIMILALCAAMLFFIIGFGAILCPRRAVLSQGELDGRTHINDPYVSMYGKYYRIPDIVNSHVNSNGWVSAVALEQTVLGRDISSMFRPTDRWNAICPNLTQPSGWDNIARNIPLAFQRVWYIHSTASSSANSVGGAAVDYFQALRKDQKGDLARDSSWIAQTLAADTANNYIIVAYDKVYDVSQYFNGQNTNNFLGSNMQSIFSTFGKQGVDVTQYLEQIKSVESPQAWARYMSCMDGLFYQGVVDHRLDAKCVISNWILLGASILLVAVIGFKFVAALQCGSRRDPVKYDKFVLVNIPCYTEGADSLTKTLEALVQTSYDDKRKLLFIVADGMVMGSGNDRPTPRIVLDILGVGADVDPEPKAYVALGEGRRQLNRAKVYSGLYEVQGRAAPFIVIVKCGSEGEVSRPGNRGKRDSQIMLMRFLSHVHFNSEMTPLDLEIYHQMKNVIGVHPSFFEYVLFVDSDTEVYPDALNRLVSCMVNDSKVIGLCGETTIANERDSWVTSLQVYEYFISHNLAKAFESMFGSVTCLPGCFSMYRIRTAKNVPLIIAPSIISEYSTNRVETLHMKNLLHLGEDRYLTTLVLKNFGGYKLTFTNDAKCKTAAPDTWAVFLSQRRRWINSTVHNLLELLWVKQLCGVCCFSMRFVVFLDLIATLLQPAAIFYIIYIIVTAIIDPELGVPTITLIMLAAVYGLQVVIFILKQEYQHIGWMIIYILASPVFAYLDLYAWWHFDDFSWVSNTRIVMDEGKVIYEMDVEEFDPSVVPMQKYASFESQLVYGSVAGREYAPNAESVYSIPPGMMLPPSTYAGSAYGDAVQYQQQQQLGPQSTMYAMSAVSNHQQPFEQQQQQVAPPSTMYAISVGSNPGISPDDVQILERCRYEIEAILNHPATSHLNKKQIRKLVQERLDVDLNDATAKKLVHQLIDDVLASHAPM
ncbi:chitin synthase [Synchytrium microbalum]|uniref:chitin synthase n=1 Tax=Synchytrium microbalum TaxID=1806994 RepID=A0A507C206_9FUNG|nr:chitin synthase [Synchytrium microbalum]TPX32124.1 chitin synthase [Synchytrium microbalum]